MAHTEESILSNFLLSPAPLSQVVSLHDFAELFPLSQRSNPQVEALFRELQHQRALITDRVQQNIRNEVRRGDKLRRDVAKARKEAQREEFRVDGVEAREIDMEIEVMRQRHHRTARD